MKLDDLDPQALDLLLRQLRAMRDANQTYPYQSDLATLTASRRELSASEQARRKGVKLKARSIETVTPDSKYL